MLYFSDFNKRRCHLTGVAVRQHIRDTLANIKHRNMTQMKLAKFIIILFWGVSLFGCSNKSNNIDKTKTTDTTEIVQIDSKSTSKPITYDIDKNLIQAAWGHGENENAMFGIFSDSLYYPDPNLWCKYEISGDTLIIIDEANFREKNLILKLTNDTLILNYLQFEIIDTLIKHH